MNKSPLPIPESNHKAALHVGCIFLLGVLLTFVLIGTTQATLSKNSPTTQAPSSFSNDLPLRFAISIDAVPPINQTIIEPTLAILRHRFGTRLEVKIYSLPALEQAIRANEVDAFLSSAGLSRRMMTLGARDLVTLASKRFPDPNHSFGAVFIVRKDRQDIHSLKDMAGKTAEIYRREGFFSYHVSRGELLQQGTDPDKFFRETIFANTPMNIIVEHVLTGKVDVGVLSSCFLEDTYGVNSPQMKNLRPINLKEATPCWVSTDQYPNWTISSLPHTPAQLSKKLTLALLSMPPIKGGMQWTVGTDFSQTDTLFRELQTGPYAFLRHWEVIQFLKNYWHWLFAAFACVLALLGYSLAIYRLNATARTALARIQKEQSELLVQHQNALTELNRLQKITVLNEMSAFLAHELGQPLAAISAFAHGLKENLSKTSLNKEKQAAERIIGQTTRICDLIMTIRRMVKHTQSKANSYVASEIVQSAVDLFSLGQSSSLSITIRSKTKRHICINKSELELAVVNLLRNSSEAYATAHTSNGSILIKITDYSQETISIDIVDQALLLNQEQIDAFTLSYFGSSKEAGLGLGLNLVRSIVTRYHGQLEFHPNTPQGLIARIVFPVDVSECKENE